MINYQEIVDNLRESDIKHLLEQLQIPYQDKGKFLVCKTACHNEDLDEASWKLYYYKDNHFFYCYTNCQGMSIFNFLKNYYEVRQIPYDWHRDIYQVVLNCSNFNFEGAPINRYESLIEKYKLKKDYNHQFITYPKGILNVFTKYYPAEWLNDGISRAAMDKYNILYSINQKKIIIPHYDVGGNLIGIRGRALDEWEIQNIGKYMPVQIEGKWYSHPLSLNLYGLNLNKENIAKYGICYVGEAEKFCLQMESFHFPNCSCAVCGSQFNKYQLGLLIKYCHPREIVICFDKEELPREDKYFNKLYKMCNKYKNYCTISFIYDKQNLLKLKDSPTDKGEKIFRKLLEGRVVIK